MKRKKLQALVEQAKSILAQDSEHRLYAFFNSPLQKSDIRDFPITNDHADILSIFNGGKFGYFAGLEDVGVINLYEYDLLAEKQMLNEFPDTNLYQFGFILSNSLCVHRQTNTVWLCKDNYEELLCEDTHLDFYDFIMEYIFNPTFYEQMIQYPKGKDKWRVIIEKMI